MQPCPTCLTKLSPKARACPFCGHPIKKSRAKKIGWILIGLSIMTAVIDSPTQPDRSAIQKPAPPAIQKPADPDPPGNDKSSTPAEKSPRIYQQSETVRVGFTTYLVSQSFFLRDLNSRDDPYTYSAPTERYLIIDLKVRNGARRPHTILPPKLIDSEGREYSPSSAGDNLDCHLGPLDPIEIDGYTRKGGVIVFDCPPGPDYRLEVYPGWPQIEPWPPYSELIQLEAIH